jgi:RNase H-like domain found in reverse transcriptase
VALIEHTHLTTMNEVDPLILYTNASTTSVAGFLMQKQNGQEFLCMLISHTLSDHATLREIMELELYAFGF